jgi:ABC-type oligopeptide transport system ATPase subunit
MSADLLEAAGLGMSFRRGLLGRGAAVDALSDFSVGFSVDQPSIVALAGQSGSGKTTAARLVLGLETPTAGQVLYRGQSLTGLNRTEWSGFRRDVQAVLQDPYGSFNPVYRVRHVFETAARKFSIGAGGAERADAIERALDFVGLDPSRLGRFPHELSGGERQRLMIARALLLRPRLIVADEPVSMVDASIRASILEIIIRMKVEKGISFLYITHDLSTAYHIADELIVLLEGQTVERGPARSVIDAPSHSYTRLLIDSVPVPDPEVRWDDAEAPAAPEEVHLEDFTSGADGGPVLPPDDERVTGSERLSQTVQEVDSSSEGR